MRTLLSCIRTLGYMAVLLMPTVIAAQSQLTNPTSFRNVADFIEGFLRAVTLIALPIVAFFLVYAGFLFVKAQGKPDQLGKARENFVYVILGAALILGAWVLATLIGGTVTQLVNG